MWASIVGFGEYHYRYATGREEDAPARGRAAQGRDDRVRHGRGRRLRGPARPLGPHTTGVGCIYIKDLEKVDLDALEAIVGRSYERLTAGSGPTAARVDWPDPQERANKPALDAGFLPHPMPCAAQLAFQEHGTSRGPDGSGTAPTRPRRRARGRPASAEPAVDGVEEPVGRRSEATRGIR